MKKKNIVKIKRESLNNVKNEISNVLGVSFNKNDLKKNINNRKLNCFNEYNGN